MSCKIVGTADVLPEDRRYMAQLAEENEYSLERWSFKEETLQFLEDLKTALTPLKDDFSMITGDCCCTSCSSYEVGLTMKEENKIYGLFWHIQDEEGIDTAEGMYIGFVANSDKGGLRAATAIVQRLREAKYDVVWDGTLEHRVFVRNKGV